MESAPIVSATDLDIELPLGAPMEGPLNTGSEVENEFRDISGKLDLGVLNRISFTVVLQLYDKADVTPEVELAFGRTSYLSMHGELGVETNRIETAGLLIALTYIERDGTETGPVGDAHHSPQEGRRQLVVLRGGRNIRAEVISNPTIDLQLFLGDAQVRLNQPPILSRKETGDKNNPNER